MNAGQVCLAIKRVYAHDAIYDRLCEELGKLANEAVVDDGLQQGTSIGPLQNRMQYEKVKGFLDDARANGTIVAGGEVTDRPGYFIRPTIVRDISDGTRLVDDPARDPLQRPRGRARPRQCLGARARRIDLVERPRACL